MSAAPTAASILRDLDRRAQQRHLDMLADLDTREHDAVRAALRAVKGAARIDVRALLDDVRRGIRDAHSFESPAERDAFHQHIADSLAAWRAECEARGVTEPAARYGVMLQMQSASTTANTTNAATTDVQPDPDDDAPVAPRKRPIPRRHSNGTAARSVGVEDAHGAHRPTAPTARARVASGPQKPAERPFIGGRCVGAGDPDRPYGASIDYDPRAWAPRPPWLLSDGDEPEETYNVTA